MIILFHLFLYSMNSKYGGGGKGGREGHFEPGPPPPGPSFTTYTTIQYSVFETVAHLMLCNTSSDALEKNSLNTLCTL